VLANDSDVDGDTPLVLVSVQGPNFSVVGSTVQFAAGATAGAKTGIYTVQDTRGATATATLTVNVSGGVCVNAAPPSSPPPPTGRGGGS
jgi:hypothetical protein